MEANHITPEEAIHSLRTEADYWRRANKSVIGEECDRIIDLIERMQAREQKLREVAEMASKLTRGCNCRCDDRCTHCDAIVAAREFAQRVLKEVSDG